MKHKNKHVLIRKFNATSNEKNYHHPTFIQYKKSPNNLFSLYHMKNKLHNKKGKKNSRGKKIKKFQIFLKAFFKYKNKRAFKKKIQPNLKWKKLSITQRFYKKSHQFISFIPYEKNGVIIFS